VAKLPIKTITLYRCTHGLGRNILGLGIREAHECRPWRLGWSFLINVGLMRLEDLKATFEIKFRQPKLDKSAYIAVKRREMMHTYEVLTLRVDDAMITT
jgi:hypothetical protein